MISLSRLLQKLPADCRKMAEGEIHFKSVCTNTTFNNSLSFYSSNSNKYYYKSNDDENPRQK